MKNLIVLGRVIKHTRPTPPQNKSLPYSCTQVRCPHCGIEYDLIDSKIEPGHVMPCGNSYCGQDVRFPGHAGEVVAAGPHLSKGTVFCTYTPEVPDGGW